MVLRVSRQLLIRKVRDRIPSPTLLSREREEKGREKMQEKFGNGKKARPRTTSDARARSKDSILSLKRERKGLDSKDVDVDVDERPLTQKQKHSKNMKQEE